MDGSLAGTGVPVISVTDQLAEQWLATADKSLQQLQDQLDQGEPTMGFTLDDVDLSAKIDIEQMTHSGRNALARLPAADHPTDQMIVIGAHVDHLGKGPTSSSLAVEDEREQIHFGADDNASGVAAMLEIAAYLNRLKAAGQWTAERDVLFAAWSGEELGLIGSSHFVNQFPIDDVPLPAAAEDPGTESASQTASLYPQIAACLNLDMVGRLDKRPITMEVVPGSRD